MIRRVEPEGGEAPWSRVEPLRGLFACVASAAEDGPREGRLDAFEAARAAAPEETPEEAHAWPAPGAEPDPEEGWRRLLALVGDGPLLVPDAAAFTALFAARSGGEAPPFPVLGAAELEALLAVRPGPGEPLPAEGGTGELRARLAGAVRAFGGHPRAARAIAARGWAEACAALRESEPVGVGALALSLALVEHPSLWAEPGEELSDGLLSDAWGPAQRGEDPLSTGRPRWTRRRDGTEPAPLPPDAEEGLAFDAEDRAVLDAVFEEHLPALFAARAGGEAGASYREGQHAVAREVAASLGAGELLLVHAPTGTGKTLAYLVPAMLWASRHGVRMGVATYTRALQEQAMDHEVPLARAALARAGFERPVVVEALKGRANYACFRALVQHEPTPTDPAWYLLAWTQLALFALSDSEGDLDRFRVAPQLPGIDPARVRRELEPLVRRVRAESGCCTAQVDRDTCAADAARRRAERAHVVVTNHSLALARPELLRHLVFDECEHLHDQAHAAWSHAVPLPELLATIERLAADNGPLPRVVEHAMPGSAAADAARSALEGAARALDAAAELEGAAALFEAWRERQLASRNERDAHSLFREYVESDAGAKLRAIHLELSRALDGTGAELAELSAHLEEVPVRGRSRLRRGLDVVRGELEEQRAGVSAWIPRGDSQAPALRPETFHDLERDVRGRIVLSARVLLPHEFLGRHYYPELASAVLLSATTYLKGGFDAAAGYLGLDRAAHPAEDEEREPTPLRTFRAPEVFDYGRVVACVPRDAPSVSRDKRRFLEYVARLVGHLGERTRGRMLVLFTNAEDCRAVGTRLAPFFEERRLPFWFQGMRGAGKEDLGRRFRERVDSILMGLDTFWFGADFPGETLEYLVVVRLPYGVPDRYHHAQCAAIGTGEQWKRIYAPRALAKFRQGFGRLLRKSTDRGAVFLLDARVLEPRHRVFLKELPLAGLDDDGGAHLVRGETDRCVREALAHMGRLEEAEERGLGTPFASTRLPHEAPLDSGPASLDPSEAPF